MPDSRHKTCARIQTSFPRQRWVLTPRKNTWNALYETSKTVMPSLEEGLKFITPLEAESKHGTLKNEVGGHGIVPGQNLSGRTDRGEGYRGDHTIMNTNYLYQQVEDTPAIDRSVHVQNLDPILVSEVSLVQFLNIAGEVHKVRITGSEAHVEFLKSKAVENALKLDEATARLNRSW